MYAPCQDIRRHPDGSLDFDFYRRRATKLRRQARRKFLRANAVPLTRALIAVAAIVAALYLAPAADGVGWNGGKIGINAAMVYGTVVAGRS